VNRLSPAALTLAALTLTACNNDRPTKTVAEYAQDPQAAQARLEVCNRLGIEERGAECMNAHEGLIERAYGHGHVSLGRHD
jgi:hypothetical protein